MKKTISFLMMTLFLSVMMPIEASENQVSMNERTGNQGRTEGVAPPVVTYDDVEGTLTVTLEAQALDA